MDLTQMQLWLSGVLLLLLIVYFYLITKETLLSNNKKLLDNVPFHFKEKRKIALIVLLNKKLDKLISYGENDSRDIFFAEIKKYSIYAFAIIILGLVFNNNAFFLFSIAVLGIPVLNRWSKRRDDTNKFKDDFFQALFYMILFINGGMSVYHSIIEANSLIDEKSPLKKSFNKIITQYNLTNENFIYLFKILADDFDIQEVNYFITSVETSYNKGISISQSLTDQLSYIRRNRNFYFKGISGNIGNKLTPLMLIFTMIPLLLILAVPPILEAMEGLTTGPFVMP